METYKLNKKCEPCGSPIPDDFQTLLCMECYRKIENENEDKKKQAEAEQFSNPASPVHPDQVKDWVPVQGILDPNYQTNPQAEDKEQVYANLAQFVSSGKMLWYTQRGIYNYVKNYCIKKVMAHPQYPKYQWKPKIVDVGCGSGVGANILSQEADMVWGIDKNKSSVQFAKECLERVKNGIYYSSQLTFDQVDIMTDSRDFMKFDIVMAIEIIEHIEDAEGFLRALITKFTKRDKNGDPHIPAEATEFFISSPNRNSPKIKKDRPQNIFHIREWTSQEYMALMRKYFEEVELMNYKGEPVLEDTQEQLILVKCKYPKNV